MDFLIDLYKPKKNSFAQIEFIDIGGVVPEGGSRKFWMMLGIAML